MAFRIEDFEIITFPFELQAGKANLTEAVLPAGYLLLSPLTIGYD
jgi:hypothetical protein